MADMTLQRKNGLGKWVDVRHDWDSSPVVIRGLSPDDVAWLNDTVRYLYRWVEK